MILITGANSGVGKEAARALAGAGATTIVSGRDPGRLAAAASDLRSTTGSRQIHELLMDVSSLAAVRAGAARVLGDWGRLDVLINNAGVILTGRQESVDGFELTLATNHLGHFLLTQLLLDRLRASAPARVVTVASTAHRGARHVGLDDLNSRSGYSAFPVYNRTKLANVLFTRELARRVAGTGITALAVHPGAVRSGWGAGGDTRGVLAAFLRIGRLFEISPRTGSAALVYAASAPGLEADNGSYLQRAIGGNFGPVRIARPSAAARDDLAAARLWDLTEEMVSEP